MLDGGPALWYLNRLKWDKANGILLTGYQAEGSGGRQLLTEGKLPIYGKMTEIDLEIDQFALSNHADHNSLSNFARECQPKNIIIFHAPEEGIKALDIDLSKDYTVHLPENNIPLNL
jgi:Cft2 family RNA processing exonuclease